MNTFAKKLALGVLMVGMAAAGVGCETHRPDMDTVLQGEHGLQSRDLREMTNAMAPDLLSIREVVANQNRVVVVMKTPKNNTVSERGMDLTIYVARLKSLLNSSAARDRVAFVEEAATLQQYQAQELGGGDRFGDGGRTVPGPDPRQKPQYVLTAEIYEKYQGRTSYYLCTFHLTDINTGVQVWEKPYEVTTLR